MPANAWTTAMAVGLILAAFGASKAGAQSVGGSGPLLEEGRPRGLPLDDGGREKRSAGWTLALDNDLLSFGDRDYDYTGGLAVTVAGKRAADTWHSLDCAARVLDRLVPRSGDVPHSGAYPLHALQVGVLAFTPSDLSARLPLSLDRPYASLVFHSNTRVFVSHPAEPVYEVTFTLGALGLDVAKAIQRGIHTGLDLDRVPRGWDYQISDGGEPTARITWARQELLRSNYQSDRTEYELRWRSEASAGYLTEGSVAVSGRWGLINTPWWSFTPERADYVSQPSPVIGNSVGAGDREFYVWGGLKLRVRGYNAFLQGQFRDSVVEVSSDRLERLIGEAWLGVTWQFSREYRLGYVIRYQSREIKDGPASRHLIWAGLILSRDL